MARAKRGTARTVETYRHGADGAAQEPDTREGSYYVSCRDGERTGLLLGPWSSHADALAAVEIARVIAEEVDPRAAFYAFGTFRAPVDFVTPGILNDHAAEKLSAVA